MKEFFQKIEAYTGVDANTSATILITLIVFGFGLFASWVSKKINDQINRNSYRRSLNHIIYNSAMACKKQSDSLASNIKNTGFINGKNYVIPILTNNAIEYLSKIDLKVVVENYITGYGKILKSEAIAELYDILGLITFHSKSDKNFEIYTEAYRNLLKNYNEGIDFLRQVNERFIVEAQSLSDGKINKESFQGKYCLIFEVWFNKGADIIMLVTYRDLILPIDGLLHQHINYTQLFFDLSNSLNKAKAAYSDIEKIDELIAQEYSERQINFKKASNSLMRILKALNHRKRLWLFDYYDLDKTIYKEVFAS